jgi:hypothetical protein
VNAEIPEIVKAVPARSTTFTSQPLGLRYRCRTSVAAAK